MNIYEIGKYVYGTVCYGTSFELVDYFRWY